MKQFQRGNWKEGIIKVNVEAKGWQTHDILKNRVVTKLQLEDWSGYKLKNNWNGRIDGSKRTTGTD